MKKISYHPTDLYFCLAAVLILAIALLLGSCGAAHGQEAATHGAHEWPRNDNPIPMPAWTADRSRHVVRVNVGNGWGSGTYLGSGFVMTACHVVENRGSRAVCYFHDMTIQGTTVAVDSDWDMGLIQLHQPHPSLPGVQLSSRNSAAGDKVYIAGYDGGRPQLLWRPGRVTGFYACESGQPRDWFNVNNPVKSGSSGGGVFDEAGNLIGNLWGSDEIAGNPGTGTMAVNLGRVQKFLNAIPQVAQASSRPCNGGYCPPRQPAYSGGVAQQPATTPIIPSQQAPVDDIAGKVIAYLDANADKFRGPQGLTGPQGQIGPPGPQGPPGPSGTCDVEYVVQQVIAYIEANPDKFRGRDGRDGSDGKDAVVTEEVLRNIADAVGARIVARVRPVGKSQ